MDAIDAYLSKRIKRLADRKRSPVTGKARLLIAAQYANFQSVSSGYDERQASVYRQSPEISTHNGWTIRSFDWSMLYPLQLNIVSPRLL